MTVLNWFKKAKKPSTTGDGLNLKPGDEHYRAYVGPPRDYDLITSMVFNLMTSLGLRQHHKILDIGCGSLRVGRLLIPYLNVENYVGIEPNEWLVTDGILNETGQDLIQLKKPVFSYKTSMEEFDTSLNLDFAVAQSIFSHCGLDLINQWLKEVSMHLKDTGALLATFLVGEEDFSGKGWIYPGCVKFKTETIQTLAETNGLQFELLNWKHPRQAWAIFYKPDYDRTLIADGNIDWNKLV